MAMFKGWCISEVLWSPISVEMENGDPYGSRDTGIVDVLETVEAPEKGPIGVRASPPEKVMRSISQLNYIYTSSLIPTRQLKKYYTAQDLTRILQPK